MLSAGFVALAGTTVAASDDVIVSDDTVVINVEKTFEENKDQLTKLGITNYKYWAYDEEYKSYVLTLDNVHFKTTANVGIAFECSASHSTEPEHHGVVIKLIGENSVVSGSEYVYKTAEEGCGVGICAGTHDQGKTSLSLMFVGDGNLVVKNEIPVYEHGTQGSWGIAADGAVIVADEATVVASGSDFTTYYDDQELYCSMGVNAAAVVVTSDLLAKGGDVRIVFENDITEETNVGILSFGIASNRNTFVNAYVHGVGGEVIFSTARTVSAALKVNSHTSGLAIDEASVFAKEYYTSIINSKVVGQSGNALGTLVADSTGIELGSKANDKIVIKDSIVGGHGGVATCIQTGPTTVNGGTESIGTIFVGSVEITGSLVQGASGELATGGSEVSGPGGEKVKANALVGIICTGDLMKVTDSIINAHAHGLADNKVNASLGIIVGYDQQMLTIGEGALAVVDSEIYAYGNQFAIFAGTDSEISFGWRAIWDLSNTTNPVSITDPAKIFSKENPIKIVSVLYKYDVIFANAEMGVLEFQRCESPNVIVGLYPGYIPEGMVFAGYLDEDGDEVAIGSPLTLNEIAPTFLVPTFELAPEAGNENAWVGWLIVIVALVVVALLVVGLCVWKSRQ